MRRSGPRAPNAQRIVRFRCRTRFEASFQASKLLRQLPRIYSAYHPDLITGQRQSSYSTLVALNCAFHHGAQKGREASDPNPARPREARL